MNKDNPLIEEYRMLTTYFEKTASIQFTLFPIFLTAIIGFVSFRFSDPSVAGLLFQLFIIILLIFLGFSHSMLHNYGLKLIEIELRMNRNLDLIQDERFTYFTNMMGEGSNSILFFKTYLIALCTILFLLYSFAEVYFWIYMKSLCINIFLILALTFSKFLFVIFIVKPLLFSDTKVIEAKQKLINTNKY